MHITFEVPLSEYDAEEFSPEHRVLSRTTDAVTVTEPISGVTHEDGLTFVTFTHLGEGASLGTDELPDNWRVEG